VGALDRERAADHQHVREGEFVDVALFRPRRTQLDEGQDEVVSFRARIPVRRVRDEGKEASGPQQRVTERRAGRGRKAERVEACACIIERRSSRPFSAKSRSI
jgi:hypothetical protein